MCFNTWSEGSSFDQSGSTTKITLGTSITWSAVLSGDAYPPLETRRRIFRRMSKCSAEFVDAEGYLLKIE
jgi:hypothetical protein